MNKYIRNIRQVFDGSFHRKYIREIDFGIGTINFRELIQIGSYILLQRELVKGGFIREFEKEFAKYIGAKYAFTFGAGRMAFYAILKTMGIKEGDEVILPGYTCVVVPNAIIYCGAKPVYVDVDLRSFTIDANKIEEKITSRTKVIVVQPMFSYFYDAEAILEIAKKYGLEVVEDCAHALGADYKGIKAGNFGHAAFFTMEATKIMTTWMEGIAVTNDKRLASKLEEFQRNSPFPEKHDAIKIVRHIFFNVVLSHPYASFLGKPILRCLYLLRVLSPGITSEERECRKPAKYPTRLLNVLAMIGLSQLRKIDPNIEHRRLVAKSYEKVLENLGCITSERTKSYNPVFIRYAFLAKDREKIKEIFRENQVELGEWFNSPVHPKDSSLKNAFYRKGSCPIAEFLSKHSVNLPTSPKISMKDVNRIGRLLEQSRDLLYKAC